MGLWNISCKPEDGWRNTGIRHQDSGRGFHTAFRTISLCKVWQGFRKHRAVQCDKHHFKLYRRGCVECSRTVDWMGIWSAGGWILQHYGKRKTELRKRKCFIAVSLSGRRSAISGSGNHFFWIWQWLECDDIVGWKRNTIWILSGSRKAHIKTWGNTWWNGRNPWRTRRLYVPSESDLP